MYFCLILIIFFKYLYNFFSEFSFTKPCTRWRFVFQLQHWKQSGKIIYHIVLFLLNNLKFSLLALPTLFFQFDTFTHNDKKSKTYKTLLQTSNFYNLPNFFRHRWQFRSQLEIAWIQKVKVVCTVLIWILSQLTIIFLITNKLNSLFHFNSK